MTHRFLSRKLWLSILVIGVAYAARVHSYVDGPQFVTLVLAAYGGYTWANIKGADDAGKS